MPGILVIQHVPHERLGMFEPAFRRAGCAVRPLHVYDPAAAWPEPEECDGVVVMGGPMSVYQQDRYPFIARELTFLRGTLKARRPVLGVCLGAQMLAAALGAKVMENPGKEIGWYPVMREEGADGDPLCAPFGQTETVFQWHGDTFALPRGAVRLFSSPLCAEQAFRWREGVYGLQFHVEVTEAMIRAWMQTPGNRAELDALRGIIDPLAIRRQSPRHIGRLEQLAGHVAAAFCELVQPVAGPARRF